MKYKKLAIGPFMAFACFYLLVMSASAAFSQSALNKNVSISFDRAPIHQALTQLFQQVGLNYALEPGVQGNVTATLKDVPFHVALESLLRANQPPLTYEVRDGVYQIHARTGYLPGTTPHTTSTPTRAAGPTKITTAVRIPIMYGNAALLMRYALGGGTIIPPSNLRNGNRNGAANGSRYGNGSGYRNGSINRGLGGGYGQSGFSGGYGGRRF